MSEKASKNNSPRGKNTAARVMAAQAVYQSIQSGAGLQTVLDEFLNHRCAGEDGLAVPDGALLSRIVLGVAERREDLDAMIHANHSNKTKALDSLLRAILLCGAWELLGNGEVDAPVIINDYLNVTHEFYEAGEVRLVNGILDSIAKVLRPQAS